MDTWCLYLLHAQRRDWLKPSDTHQPFLHLITLLLRSLLQHHVGSDLSLGLPFVVQTLKRQACKQTQDEDKAEPLSHLNCRELKCSAAAFTYYSWFLIFLQLQLFFFFLYPFLKQRKYPQQVFSPAPPRRAFYGIMSLPTNKRLAIKNKILQHN